MNKTIILNGSPKANPQESNSRIYAEAFTSRMQNPCEIRRIKDSNLPELAEYAQQFDTIIFVLPLYIHAMPGMVMRFIERLEPAEGTGKSLGFILQAGFEETAQERFVERYFRDLAEQLKYHYLGTVSKGGAAGTYMMPKMFRKVLEMVADLGAAYEATGQFDAQIVSKLGHPYQLTKANLRVYAVASRLGLTNIGWHKMLKQNKAFDQRLDKPYLSSQS